MSEKHKVFVLMPFDPEFNTLFERVIKPTLEQFDFIVSRADINLNQENILRDVVSGIAGSDLLLADLTSLNANVLYELGIAHGLDRPTVMLTQSFAELPFDLKGYKAFEYGVRFDEVEKLEDFLRKVGESFVAGKMTFGNPVSDFSSVRDHGQLGRIGPSETAEPKIPSGENEEDVEKGFVDYVLDGEEAADVYLETLTTIAEDTRQLGSRIAEQTDEINKLNSSSAPGKAARMGRIAAMVAHSINGSASKLEENLPSLETSLDTLSESYVGYLSWLDPESKRAQETLINVKDSVQSLRSTAEESLQKIRGYREAVDGLRLSGISGEINRSSSRYGRSLDRLVALTEKTIAFATRIDSLIEQKLSTLTNGSTGGEDEDLDTD